MGKGDNKTGLDTHGLGAGAVDLRQVDRYYSEKVAQHGAVPAGVDWNSEASQELRFSVLLSRWKLESSQTLLDYGCGYGALLGYMNQRGLSCQYTGFDISAEMLKAARAQHGDVGTWLSMLKSDNQFDYVVASGIFNVKLEHDPAAWARYIEQSCEQIDRIATRGFAINFLTSHSDKPFQRPHLYYAEPTALFNRLMEKHPRRVALLHDYPLYEFTLIVAKGQT